MKELKKQLKALPKADVHNHLHLSGTIDMLNEHYPESRFKIPKTYDGFDGMMRFIVQHVNTLMRTSEDVVMLMDMAIRSSINDNVTHLEASIDTKLAYYFDNTFEEFFNAVSELKEKYKSEIDFRPEIGLNKALALDKVYQDGIACIESNVFTGIDLYGEESNQDLNGFKEIYQEARVKSMKTKVHIGEFSDYQSIIRAIETLGPDEIQHGINAADSEETMQLILDRSIRVNICPYSNVALRAVSSLEEHPIRRFYDAGVKITINTDDFLLFNSTITDQFSELIERGLFTFEEIDEIRQNALPGENSI